MPPDMLVPHSCGTCTLTWRPSCQRFVNAVVVRVYMLQFLGQSYRVVVRASTDIEKCIKLFDTEPAVVDSENAVPLEISETQIAKKERGELVFKNVSFHYKVDSRTKGGVGNISFTVKPGKMLGIVGASGAFSDLDFLKGLQRGQAVNQGSNPISISCAATARVLFKWQCRGWKKVRMVDTVGCSKEPAHFV